MPKRMARETIQQDGPANLARRDGTFCFVAGFGGSVGGGGTCQSPVLSPRRHFGIAANRSRSDPCLAQNLPRTRREIDNTHGDPGAVEKIEHPDRLRPEITNPQLKMGRVKNTALTPGELLDDSESSGRIQSQTGPINREMRKVLPRKRTEISRGKNAPPGHNRLTQHSGSRRMGRQNEPLKRPRLPEKTDHPKNFPGGFTGGNGEKSLKRRQGRFTRHPFGRGGPQRPRKSSQPRHYPTGDPYSHFTPRQAMKTANHLILGKS
jgi:hypothetical protein